MHRCVEFGRFRLYRSRSVDLSVVAETSTQNMSHEIRSFVEGGISNHVDSFLLECSGVDDKVIRFDEGVDEGSEVDIVEMILCRVFEPLQHRPAIVASAQSDVRRGKRLTWRISVAFCVELERCPAFD